MKIKATNQMWDAYGARVREKSVALKAYNREEKKCDLSLHIKKLDK